MKSFILISCLLVASASANFFADLPHVTTTQFHSQDGFKQYSYGYSDGLSTKQETQTINGITKGSYSYTDPNGIVQTVSYVSDPVNGFRVATNLPRAPAPIAVSGAPADDSVSSVFDHASPVRAETPEVIAARAARLAARHKAVGLPTRRWKRSLVAPAPVAYSDEAPDYTTVVHGPGGRSFSYSTVAGSVAPASTVVVAAPTRGSFSYSTVASSPVTYLKSSSYSSIAGDHPALFSPDGLSRGSQFRNQDAFGRYNYGYSDGFSSKTESRSVDGITHGEYSYVDSNGILQTVKYVADGDGFRVRATNLPVRPSA